jgi:hypothetical protein
MYKLAVFIPETHLETVKAALFAAGAGKIGCYDRCCWQSRGTGQFRPLPGSDPFITVGEDPQDSALHPGSDTVQVTEYKVELVCDDHLIRDAVRALRQAHPYEAPAFDVWKLETF